MIRALVTALTSPELLEAQAAALHRHMADEFELIVVNDACEQEHFSNVWQEGMPERIEWMCQDVGARHIRFPQELHRERERIFPDEPQQWRSFENANTRCADAIQYGANLLLAESDEPLLILDADMVPYHRVAPEALLALYPIWGVPQQRSNVRYLWNGILLIDPRHAAAMDEFNLDCGHPGGIPVDVGGMLFRFVIANEGRIGTFDICSAQAWLNRGVGIDLPAPLAEFFRWDCETQTTYRISETYGGMFAHLGGGGNWEVRPAEQAQERVRRFVEAITT